jgi:prevent-host-death family protein
LQAHRGRAPGAAAPEGKQQIVLPCAAMGAIGSPRPTQREPIDLVQWLVYSVAVAPKIVNVHEAKTHLSRLLARVARGEEIVIAKAGKPIARLVPAERPTRMSDLLGVDEGAIWMAGDFDAPLPGEILASFEGAPEDPT